MTPQPVFQRPAGVKLVGTGLAVPPKVLNNQDLAKIVDTTDDWISQRTGIKERRILENGASERDLARDALADAINAAGMQPTDLDMVICATMTPEMACPSTAARVVAEVGASPAGAVDVSAACSGFVYGLNMGASLIETGRCKTVGVIGTEALSRLTNWEDRKTCVLFGDGAGAAVITACDDPQQGCLYQTLGSNGNLWRELYVPREDSHIPEGGTFNGGLGTLQMNGREVYKFAVSTLMKMIEEVMQACSLTPADLAVIVPHQSNRRILESAREKLNLREDQLYINIDRYGNTSAASVPIALHEVMQTGRIKKGDLVLFLGLGGGVTWSSSLWRM